MRKCALFAAAALLTMALAAISSASPRVYLGWYNDGDRSVAGHGCQVTEAVESEVCWNGETYYNCAYGDGWLWIYTGDAEIERIKFGWKVTKDIEVQDGCQDRHLYWNSGIIESTASEGESWWTFISYWDIDFSVCQGGWIHLCNIHWYYSQGWTINMSPDQPGIAPVAPRAWLCGTGEEVAVIILANYTLDPVQPDIWEGGDLIGTDNSSWGAIKSLFR